MKNPTIPAVQGTNAPIFQAEAVYTGPNCLMVINPAFAMLPPLRYLTQLALYSGKVI